MFLRFISIFARKLFLKFAKTLNYDRVHFYLQKKDGYYKNLYSLCVLVYCSPLSVYFRTWVLHFLKKDKTVVSNEHINKIVGFLRELLRHNLHQRDSQRRIGHVVLELPIFVNLFR